MAKSLKEFDEGLKNTDLEMLSTDTILLEQRVKRKLDQERKLTNKERFLKKGKRRKTKKSATTETNSDSSYIPEVYGKKLLRLLHRLSRKGVGKQSPTEICLKKHSSKFETSFDAPSVILNALRQCVFSREWDKMTDLLLVLLNRDKRYLGIVGKMCRLMIKFHPLIKELGLQDTFTRLIEPVSETETRNLIC